MHWDMPTCSKTGRAMVPYLGGSFRRDKMIGSAVVFHMLSQEGGVNTHAVLWYIVLFHMLYVTSSCLWITYEFPLLSPPLWLKTNCLDSVLCLLVVLKSAFACLLLPGFCHGVEYLVSYLFPLIVWTLEYNISRFHLVLGLVVGPPKPLFPLFPRAPIGYSSQDSVTQE